MSGMDRLTDEAFEAAQFLYKHGDLTYSAARAAVAKLTDNGFTIRRASQAAPAPSDRLVSVGKASGLVEARVSLAARQIRQTLRDYGHRCAETSLPELIAADVDAALRKQDEVHTPAPSDGLREAAERAVDEWAEHLEDGDPVPTWVAPLAAALAQEGETRHD